MYALWQEVPKLVYYHLIYKPVNIADQSPNSLISRREENETDHLLTKYHKKIRLFKLKNKENYILVYDWVCVEEVNHKKHLVIYGAETNTVARKV